MSAQQATEYQAAKQKSYQMRQKIAELNAKLNGIWNAWGDGIRTRVAKMINRAEEQYAQARGAISAGTEEAQDVYRAEKVLLESKYRAERAAIEDPKLKPLRELIDKQRAELARTEKAYADEKERCEPLLQPVEAEWLYRSEFLEAANREAGELRNRVLKPSLPNLGEQ